MTQHILFRTVKRGWQRCCALLTLTLLAIGTHAQTWTASAPAAGEFYLYNVGRAAFLVGGHNYGTRASLTQQGGIPVTLVDGGDGGYYVSTSPTYEGLFLGSDGYVDVASTSSRYTTWKFVPVAEEEGAYLLQASKTGAYLVGMATTPDNTTTRSAVPTTNLGYWKLASRESLLAHLANASEENPLDATFLIADPNFGRSTNVSGLWMGDPAHGGVDENYCVEKWNTTFDVYQTLTGLPNGVYKMTVQGFYRTGDGTNDASKAGEARAAGREVLNAKYYLNEAEGTLMSIFDSKLTRTNNTTYNTSTAVKINGVNYYVPNNMSRASSCFMQGEYTNEPIRAVVTDGTLRLGVRKTVVNSQDWAIWDNFTLTYCGMDFSALVENYHSQLQTARNLLPQPMAASVRTVLEEALAAAESDVDLDNPTWLEGILGRLGAAISSAQASHAHYMGDILDAVKGMKAQSVSEAVGNALQTKYDEGAYGTAGDVYAAYQLLEIAQLPQEENTDYTSVLINPGFELGNTDGWEFDLKGEDTGARSTSSDTYRFSGTEGDYLFNTWISNISTLDIKQTVSGLPNGNYTLSAMVATFGDGAPVTLTANAESNSFSVKADDVDAEKLVGHLLTVEDVLVSDGTLSIKLQNRGKGHTLMKADAFRLTFVKPYEDLDNYADLSLTVNLENNEVRRYLANTSYTRESASLIENYNTNESARNDQPATITIPIPLRAEEGTLFLALNSDFAEATTRSVAAGTVRLEIPNLQPQQTYYYKVEMGGEVVTNGTITTTGRLRMIKSEGISNMRDMGGWRTAEGGRIRYGKLYRGSELTGGKRYQATEADLAMLRDLGIRGEVDLREDVDLSAGRLTASGIEGAAYTYENLNRWGEDALNLDNEKFRDAFSLVYKTVKGGGAAYFHCIFGADRTGCFAFLLGGLMGLPVDQLYKDYELTSFSSAGRRDKTGIDHKIQYISALQGRTLQEKFFNYWRGAVGIPEADLRDFIRLMVEGESSIIETALEPLPEAVVPDGEYYLYLPGKGKFLGRGETYGTRAVADNYGVPARFTTNGVGVTTICYLDNGLYLGSDGYTDKGAFHNSVSWSVERKGDNLILKSHNGSYLRAFENVHVRADAPTATTAVAVGLKSAAEQRAMVAAAQQANVLRAAAAAGIEADSYEDFQALLGTGYELRTSTAVIRGANKGNTAYWVLSEPDAHGETGNFGNAYNVGDYGGELYQKNGCVSQTVTVPRAGLYRLTLTALYRQGRNRDCYAIGQRGFELSNAYVSINDAYFAQIPSWYTACTGSETPNTTDEAKQLMDAGKYGVELYAYIGVGRKATITVHVPGFTPFGWCLFNNFKLEEVVKAGTAVSSPLADEEAVEYFDLSGRRVYHPRRGIYLQKGRRLLVK